MCFLRSQAADRLWASYPAAMGDASFWGPRPRLSCAAEPSAPFGPARPSASGPSASGRAAATTPLRRMVLPSEAVRCMEHIRAALGDRARLFVAVDAPRLQQLLALRLGRAAFVTPGVGVDPTNVFRDGDGASAAAIVHYREQITGRRRTVWLCLGMRVRARVRVRVRP